MIGIRPGIVAGVRRKGESKIESENSDSEERRRRRMEWGQAVQ